MKRLLLVFTIALMTATSVIAGEGMWLPMLIKRLDQQNLKEMGLHLTPAEIYSINNSSLKDAVVRMGGGFCTGEIISSKGLLLTNHHCGYSIIQEHSTTENNYLAEGFWAENMKQEKRNPGLSVSFLVRMEDVTDRVLSDVSWDMNESDREKKVNEIAKQIEQEATTGNHYDAEVKSFFEGNEYYLFVYETFRDVRFVGAPPTSIGKFGGDADNWEWPRHTGDFSLFRVYTGPDGMPADYSEDNIPLKPKHHLPISLDGVEQGDFTMTFGFPGSTDRYLTSYGVEQAINITNPAIVEVRDKKLEVLKKDMKADEAIDIMYASKYAQIANYWKYYIGQTEQIKNNEVLKRKKDLEKEFSEWVNAKKKRKEKYGEALTLIDQAYDMLESTAKSGVYVREAALTGADAVLFAFRLDRMYQKMLEAEEDSQKKAMMESMKERVNTFYNEHNLPTDRKLFATTMSMFHKNIVKDQQPDYLVEASKKYKGDFQKWANDLYDESYITNKEELLGMIEEPNKKKWEKDPMVNIARKTFELYSGNRARNAEAYDKLSRGMRLFEAGLQEMKPKKDFYPDANSTMRVSFGQVQPYSPSDAVSYEYFTTLEGVMEKEDPNDDEFIVPAKLKGLYEQEDYGRYADEDGDMWVNFISTNDITGGNSGSPVIDGRGRLIGLAFDGNWEAMSGDISFEEEVQRTINVDIRYVCFIIDKFAGADHLIKEMTFLKGDKSGMSHVEEMEKAEKPQKNQKAGKAEEMPTR